MELLVNSQPIDLKIEDERTLGEVISGVRSWLAESRLLVTDISVDDDDVPLEVPSTWGEKAVDDVGTIQIEAHPQWQVDLALLDTAVDELADAESAKNLDSTGRSRLLDTVKFLHHLDLGMVRDRLEKEQPLGADDIAAAATILRSRRREIAQPYPEARGTASLIEEMLPQVEEVAVLVQTGKEAQAMGILIRFIELVSRLLRLFGHLTYAVDMDISQNADSDGPSLEDATRSLNGPLNELIGAFAAGDTVLVGDLLEYEVVPRVRELLTYLPDVTPTSASEGGGPGS